MIKTRMKTPLLDQIERRKEESQARILNHQKAQSQWNQSHLALPKAPKLSLNLLKPDKPLTLDRAWNKSKSVNSRPPQKWINTIAKAKQPPRTFDELMGTPIDFLAYVINCVKIDNLTQEILVGPAFNLLKGSCRRIITNVKVMRWYDYGHLEEIVVQRDDNVLYKFKKGDFLRLNLHDIKDMLLLLVQKKLFNLDVDDQYDL
nr:hypothetical protein [Tanacetum cinerariifolium]